MTDNSNPFHGGVVTTQPNAMTAIKVQASSAYGKPAGEVPKPCPLCQLWRDSPYALRHTTPMRPEEGHAMMVRGYWVAAEVHRIVARGDAAPQLCEAHSGLLNRVTAEYEERARLAQEKEDAERAAAEERLRVPPELRAAQADYERRAATVVQVTCPDCQKVLASGEVHLCEPTPPGHL